MTDCLYIKTIPSPIGVGPGRAHTKTIRLVLAEEARGGPSMAMVFGAPKTGSVVLTFEVPMTAKEEDR
jgi:hypothetical protein